MGVDVYVDVRRSAQYYYEICRLVVGNSSK